MCIQCTDFSLVSLMFELIEIERLLGPTGHLVSFPSQRPIAVEVGCGLPRIATQCQLTQLVNHFSPSRGERHIP